MAIRMQQHQILQLVAPPFVPLDLVVNVPPRLERNVLLTHRASLELSNPQGVNPPFTLI